jgi:hypothetical protein
MRVSCTLIITAPSFKCRFTFLPRKDLALFKLKLSVANSPLNLLFGKAAPTLPADGQFFSLKENVQLDVLTLALVFPRIFAMLQHV